MNHVNELLQSLALFVEVMLPSGLLVIAWVVWYGHRRNFDRIAWRRSANLASLFFASAGNLIFLTYAYRKMSGDVFGPTLELLVQIGELLCLCSAVLGLLGQGRARYVIVVSAVYMAVVMRAAGMGLIFGLILASWVLAAALVFRRVLRSRIQASVLATLLLSTSACLLAATAFAFTHLVRPIAPGPALLGIVEAGFVLSILSLALGTFSLWRRCAQAQMATLLAAWMVGLWFLVWIRG